MTFSITTSLCGGHTQWSGGLERQLCGELGEDRSGTKPASRRNGGHHQLPASAFGQTGNIRFSIVTDGLSNTVFMGEILQGELYDIRGVIWQTSPGGVAS